MTTITYPSNGIPSNSNPVQRSESSNTLKTPTQDSIQAFSSAMQDSSDGGSPNENVLVQYGAGGRSENSQYTPGVYPSQQTEINKIDDRIIDSTLMINPDLQQQSIDAETSDDAFNLMGYNSDIEFNQMSGTQSSTFNDQQIVEVEGQLITEENPYIPNWIPNIPPLPQTDGTNGGQSTNSVVINSTLTIANNTNTNTNTNNTDNNTTDIDTSVFKCNARQL